MSSEKRILKPLKQRKPEESLSYPDLIHKVTHETKYRKTDVKLVVDTALEIIAKNIKDKKMVRLPGIGALFPTIKRSRVGMSMNGGVGKPVRMVVPDRWMLRFHAAGSMEQDLYKLKVSKEELDEMYRN